MANIIKNNELIIDFNFVKIRGFGQYLYEYPCNFIEKEAPPIAYYTLGIIEQRLIEKNIKYKLTSNKDKITIYLIDKDITLEPKAFNELATNWMNTIANKLSFKNKIQFYKIIDILSIEHYTTIANKYYKEGKDIDNNSKLEIKFYKNLSKLAKNKYKQLKLIILAYSDIIDDIDNYDNKFILKHEVEDKAIAGIILKYVLEKQNIDISDINEIPKEKENSIKNKYNDCVNIFLCRSEEHTSELSH
jgi:hypothetical protein